MHSASSESNKENKKDNEEERRQSADDGSSSDNDDINDPDAGLGRVNIQKPSDQSTTEKAD